MELYQVIYGGDADGLYCGQQYIVGWWTLWKHGIEIHRLMHWSQKSLARLAQEFAGQV